MDHCSGNDATLKDDRGQVTVYFLPPNTTSIFQPLDQGIIASTKSHYRHLLAKMVAAVDTLEELQNRAKSVPNGRKGLEFGCTLHVLDAAKLIKISWDAVTPSTIAACWSRASCLYK